EALAIVATRGQLMQRLPGGAMLSVPLSEQELAPLLGSRLSLAAVNGPRLCVVSGETDAVAALERALAERQVQARRLRTSHAFHSAMTDPILEPLAARLREVALHPPRVPFISNLSGGWISAEEAQDPDYWAR